MALSFMQVSKKPAVRYVVAPALVAGIGALKEYTDPSRGGVRSWADMNANLAGIGSAIVIDSLIRFAIVPTVKKIFLE